MAAPVRIGLVGTGFMGRAHSNAWRQVGPFFPELRSRPVLQAACGRDPARLDAFAADWGWSSVETDWRQLVSRRDIDAIDICAPNRLHRDIALAAAAEGKMVLCEKPLATRLDEAEEMVQAAESAGVPTMVWYNYRRVPAVCLAKTLIDEGRLGRVFHYRAGFLQDWTIGADLPQGGRALWRLDVHEAGSGVTGDLLAHCLDTARWLNGSVLAVTATTETFIKERRHVDTDAPTPVGIDDAAMVLARFENGSLGLFESTRYARGHKARKTFEINGADASLAFDLEEAQYLHVYEHRSRDGHLAGWRRIHVTASEHPYMSRWWVPGLTIGYEHSFIHAAADFLAGLDRGAPAQPDFRSALETERVCAAILRSAASGRWEEPTRSAP